MNICRHEWKTGRISLAVWTLAIISLLTVCIFIYPEMAEQMEELNDTFSQMGSFSYAFGMDKINFGEFIGFFGVECGNILGLGGALFAALLGISSLSKEEKGQTAEFLLSHPISRVQILAEKLSCIVFQITLLNAAAIAATAFAAAAIGESPDLRTMALLFLAYFLMQLEIAFICFGISAFLRQGGVGIGLGLAASFYFLNLIANLASKAKFLKYLTPFGYTESADIITDQTLNGCYIACGALFAAAGITAAFVWYCRKDIT